MSHRSFFWGTCIAAVLVLAACGRSDVVNNATDGGLDGSGDGPPPCTPTCAKICAMEQSCGMITSGDVAACESKCNADPSAPEILCLGQLVCKPAMDCAAAKQCLINPQVPDLTVTHTASSPSAGMIRYQATVCNTGSGAAPTFRVHFYRNRSNAPSAGEYGDKTYQLSGLAAGACQTVGVTDSNLAQGSYNTWTMVDADKAVVEINETNNVYGPYKVAVQGGSSKLPDLVVQNLTAVPATSGSTTYFMTVCNYGQGPTTGTSRFQLYFHSNSAPTQSATVNRQFTMPTGFQPGTCANFKAAQTLGAGTYKAWGRADNDQTVKEGNETNNTFGPVSYTVGGTDKVPDLVFSIVSASVGPSGTVYYKGIVVNKGAGPVTSAFYVGLFHNLASGPGPYNTADKQIYMGSYLAPGASQTFSWTTTLKSGVYTAWARVDDTFAIKESSEYNNTYGPMKFTVSGGGTLPDLVVSKFSASSSPFGLTTFSAYVCNMGNATAPTSYLWLYTHRTSAPGPYDKPDTELSLGTMYSGSCKTLTWQAALKAGTYVAWAMVDGKNIVKESNEYNNTASTKYTVQGGVNMPDLVVSKLSASTSSSGSTVYTATVCNKGTASAVGYSYVYFYINRSTQPQVGDKPDGMTYLGYNITAGNCVSRTWTTLLKPGATYLSWALADGSGAVKEGVETNNAFGPVKVSPGGAGQPDLVISNMTATANSLGSTTYNITVCNKGNIAAGSYSYVWIYINSPTKPGSSVQPNKVLYVGGLNPGGCVPAIWSTSLAAGSYSSWAVADGYNYVKESNENNNHYGPVKFTVGGTQLPDLTVTMKAAPSGSTATYYVTMCNSSSVAASGNLYVWFYQNSASKPGTGVKPTATLYMGSSLSAGGCVTKTYQASGLAAGTYYSWATADPYGYVKESNESNNTYGPLTVTIGGTTKLPDLVPSMSATTSSTGATYKISVCNKGTVAASGVYVSLFAHSASKPTASSSPTKVLYMAATLSPGLCVGTTSTESLKPGTYSSWLLADQKNSIKESNESNNTYGPVKVTVGGTTKLPDLVPTLSAKVGPSGQVYYSVQICNKGAGAASGYIYLPIYVNSAAKPGASTPYNKQFYLGTSMAAGACQTLSWQTTLKPGTYFSWAVADQKNYIKESNETNNHYGPVKITVTGTTTSADLYIAGISINQTYTYTYLYVQVCNGGKLAVPYAKVELYYNRSTKPSASTVGDRESYVYNLNPGQCQQRSFYTVLSPGKYSSWAYVDRSNAVKESNEANNVYGPKSFTIAGTGKPDLYISSVSATQTTGYVYYYVTLCNKGTAMAGLTNLDLYYNRSSAPPTSLAGNTKTTTSVLNPGACQTRTMYAGLPGGTYTSWIRVDRTNVVYETNENNNLYGPLTVKVSGTGKPDLQITGVSFASSPTGYHYYYVTLCNKGTATAVNTTLEVYYNRATKPTASLTGDYQTSTGTLYAGACTTRTVYAALSPGTYNSWFYLDRTNAVLESNEANNVFGPKKVTVGGAGTPDLTITSINPVQTSSYMYYYITVCNKGKGTAAQSIVDLYYNSPSAPSSYMPGNRSTTVSQLAGGACITRTIYASGLPGGTLKSWARIDRTNQVKETNENNNVFGPVTVLNNTLPDLQVTSLTAQAYSAGYTLYRATVCNYGKANVSYAYLDIYYNRSYAPSTYVKGDTSIYVSSLGVNQCRQVTRGVTLQSGTYTSWARVDRQNYVKESNENNNVRGPYKFTVGSTPNQCPIVCGTLTTTCGLPSSQYAMCISYCNSMSQAKKDCAYKNALAKNCNGIMGCL